MTDLRTAAQQALEALEEYQSKGAPFLACDGAVDALRAALAQQAEPAQEPVAWMFELARNFNLEGYGGWEKRITEYRPSTPEGSVRNVTPLYTSPPQRKPLTEEEIDNICRQAHGGADPQEWSRNFARAVERAVWEKNNG